MIYLLALVWQEWEWNKLALNVYIHVNLINTRGKNMKSYTETSQRVATSEMYEQLTFQDQMFGSLAHPVKTSQSQDLEKDWGGDRSSLISEVFRLIEEKAENKPEWLVYENVKGMLSSNGGWDFMSILLGMEELGYDVEWQTLNSKHFGLPQNRERVYTIGHLREYGRKQILPIQSTNGKDCIPKVIGGIGEKDSNNNKQWKQQNRIYDNNISISVTTKFQPFYLDNNFRIRKLTPKECMRLQGVPDEYTDKLIQAGISDSQIYKAAGDGLSVPIAKEIGERIRKTYEENN